MSRRARETDNEQRCGAKTRASRKITCEHTCVTRMLHDVPASSRCQVATKPPPPHACLHPLSTQVQRRRPSERAWRAGKEKDRDTQQSGGREKVHVREKGRGKGKEQRSHERNKGRPAAEQGARTGKGARQAHSEHNTAPRHRRGEHQRNKGRAAPRTTTRTAQTPHTPHTPNEPQQPAQWAGSRGRDSA